MDAASRSWVWARAEGAAETVAIVNIAKAGLRIRLKPSRPRRLILPGS
jgi:hypothetical protein